MIVYRTMTSNELLNLINGTNREDWNTIKGQNTFKYEKNIKYIHFFKYQEHALYYMKRRSNHVIAKINLPNEIIPPIEYGFYGGVETYYDNSLSNKFIPLPEYVLDRRLFNKKFIIDFSSNGSWSNPLNRDICVENEIWIEKKFLFRENELQKWKQEDIYYQYIKKLLIKFNGDPQKVALYLKEIDLDEKINNMGNKIKKEKIITKRKYQ